MVIPINIFVSGTLCFQISPFITKMVCLHWFTFLNTGYLLSLLSFILLYLFFILLFSLIYTATLLNLASSKRIKDPSPSKSIRHASICRWKLVSAKRCGKSKPLCQMDIQSPVKHLRRSFLSFINYLYKKLPLRLMTGF